MPVEQGTEDLESNLRYFGTTRNEPDNPRQLFAQAAAEISRLRSLVAPVECFNCHVKIERGGDWYRCFDCKVHLCERCTEKHFGQPYSAHHRTMEHYEQVIEMLKRRLEKQP